MNICEMSPLAITISVIVVVVIIIIVIVAAYFATRETDASGSEGSGYVVEEVIPPAAPESSPSPLVPSTPRKRTYKFYPNRVSPGGNFVAYRRYARDIPKLSKLCDARPTCVGFSADGYFKNTIKPESQWITQPGEGSGLYVAEEMAQ